jgi:ubiquinone/menaquinone biosynthesis C-methylase UbiE
MTISYDEIASDYAVHRSVHPGLLRRLVEFPLLGPESRVLEVGCGTGNYIRAIASATSANCFGLDPSAGMLEKARKGASSLTLSQGSGEGLPHPDGSFNFIFSVDVIHHVRDRRAFFAEAFRALRPGGWLATGTDSEKIIRERMPLSCYFPETVEAELGRYPKDGEIPRLLQAQNFAGIFEDFVEFSYSLSDSTAFERKAFSSLRLISDDAFAKGLNRMKDDLKRGPISCVSRYVIHWGQKRSH